MTWVLLLFCRLRMLAALSQMKYPFSSFHVGTLAGLAGCVARTELVHVSRNRPETGNGATPVGTLSKSQTMESPDIVERETSSYVVFIFFGNGRDDISLTRRFLLLLSARDWFMLLDGIVESSVKSTTVCVVIRTTGSSPVHLEAVDCVVIQSEILRIFIYITHSIRSYWTNEN